MKRSEFKALSYKEQIKYLSGGRVDVYEGGRKTPTDFLPCYHPTIRSICWKVGKVRRKGYDTRDQALCAGHVLMRQFKAKAKQFESEVRA